VLIRGAVYGSEHPGGPDELLLAVDGDGLAELVRLLRAGEPASVEVVPQTGGKEPRAIRRVDLVPGPDEQPLIAASGEVATIGGTREALALLAEEMVAFDEWNDLDEPGTHHHVEPVDHPRYEGFLAPGSMSLFLAGPNL
jgi:hypothetical protein